VRSARENRGGSFSVNLWAVVPAKPLAQAKSRLAAVLAPAEREQLAHSLLCHTLDVLASLTSPVDRVASGPTPGLAGILVVSADWQVCELAAARGVAWLPELAPPELNRALEQGAVAAQARGAQGVLVVPGDLPHLTAAAVAELLAVAGEPPVMVIAPDRREEGTNALLVAPPGLIPFGFGPGSFQRHVAAARATGGRTVIWRHPAWAYDVDWPEDLALLQRE